jgi:hypothetical protein
MSLVQHVSAVEGTDRVDLASLYDSPDNASLQLGRRLSLTLSYDPLPRIGAVATEKLEPEGSYKVSAGKRTGIDAPSINSSEAHQLQHKSLSAWRSASQLQVSSLALQL